jgi:hypothetical protein
MIALLYIGIGLQAVDFYTTYRGIKSSKLRELNPVVIWLMARLGTTAGLALAKIIGIALCFVLYSILPMLLVPLNIFYIYVAYNNFKLLRG